MADKSTSRYPRLRKLRDALRRPFSRVNSHPVSPQQLQPVVAPVSPPAAASKPQRSSSVDVAPVPVTDSSGGDTTHSLDRGAQSVQLEEVGIDNVALALDATPGPPAVAACSAPSTPLAAAAQTPEVLSSVDDIPPPAAESFGGSAVRPSDAGTQSMNVKEVVLDSFGLALDVVEKLAGFGETIPFVAPVANVLSQLVKGYKEVKAVDEKRDVLLARIMDIAQNLCSTIQVLKEKNHLDLIGRLKGDIEQYTRLLVEASTSVVEYNGLSAPLRAVAGTQFGTKFTDIQEKLASFGDRFRMNRLVDIVIQQGSFKQKVDKVHDIVLGKKLEQWLQSPPDMLQKQYEMQKLRQDGTGLWFLDGHMFAVWQDNPGVLWIEGDSGTGKSVLSSSVVNRLNDEQTRLRALGPLPAVAFFYFDINHKSGNMVDMALRRIILQLSAQSANSYGRLEKRYNQSNGQITPNFLDLQTILEELLRELGRTYLVLDALDECDEQELPWLLQFILTLRSWTESPLHLLITSQRRTRFTHEFAGLSRVVLESQLIGHDIKAVISHEIQQNHSFQIWKSRAGEVIERVTNRSSGMFRLATCILLELSRCTHQRELDSTLADLPADLFEIYGRFFGRIRSQDRVFAVAVLRWLLFSNSILSLAQLADARSFDVSNTGELTFNPTLRIENQCAIPRWLEGLTNVSQLHTNQEQLLFAHASVQDYFSSPQFTDKFGFNLSSTHSHSFIAQSCISYLLYLAKHPFSESTHLSEYPLGIYAANNWYHHLSHAEDRASLLPHAIHLFGGAEYVALDRLCHWGWPRHWSIYGSNPRLDAPIFMCVRLEYVEAVSHLLQTGVDVHQFNEHGQSLLDVAVEQNSVQLVRTLLDNGANPNDSPVLWSASEAGHTQIVQLLLKGGADPMIPTPNRRLWHEYIEIVPLLLADGADTHAVNRYEGTPLWAAAASGHTEIARLLLEYGAQIIPGPGAGNPIQAAVSRGHRDTVQLLLNNGADSAEVTPLQVEPPQVRPELEAWLNGLDTWTGSWSDSASYTSSTVDLL
ncbi:hypothetical protein C8R46DRAFT_1184977 [Mycena filopes]|nr:hypothetical protein C8R46DRAFT_1184977 [Mycena filopes]